MKKEGGRFFGILVVAYITELLYLASYIGIRNGKGKVFVWGYLISLVVLISLVAAYFIVSYLKDKYANRGRILRDKIKKVDVGIGIVDLVLAVIIGGSKLGFDGELLVMPNKGLFIICGLFLIVEFIGVVGCFKVMKKKRSFQYLGLFLIQLLVLGFQYYFGRLEILESGMIFVVIYLYVVLESIELERVRQLELQLDYALGNHLDKVAFLKNLSHEIRTPINVIDGFSQVIEESEDLVEIKDDISDIRGASRELLAIVNGMIDLSIIEAGKLELILENYNVYEMLDQISGIVESKMRDKNVKLILDISNDLPEVLLGDSERISQVVLNLLMNSIKYTEVGEITLRVRSVKSSSKCRLIIEVQDTGKGMEQKQVLHLFDEADEETRGGISLRISKYLVEAMNGELEVESEVGKGTLFTVTIDQKIISLQEEERHLKKKNIKPFAARDKRILLVDDNKLNLKVAKRLLEPYEVEVVEVNSGQECLEILDVRQDFDLILMDDLMPEMSGTEVLNILKKIERVDGYYIPVVVLTANATTGMKEKYLESGFEDYLAKPIEKGELDRVLRKYLKGRK